RRFRKKVFVKQAQDPLDLRWRRFPSRGGEREKSQRVNAQARRGFNDPGGGFSAGAMAGRARQSSCNGPAAVAVRNDGHVQARSVVRGRLRQGNLPYRLVLQEHVLSPPRSKSCKLLCNTKHGDKKNAAQPSRVARISASM